MTLAATGFTGHHVVVPLSEVSLLKAAGDVVYARGEDYVRYVRGLRTTASKAYASIQAKRAYTVELDWSGSLPTGSCSCPHNADGNFCKHLVATGLAAIDSGRVALDEPNDGVRRTLEIRATAASGDDTHAKAELEAYVRDALSFRGFVDYRRSFEVAQAASDMLDELENYLENGAAEIARPALLRALTRLRKILEHVDDSSGVIGDECQRAADLYAWACRLGKPDRHKLATWLVKFRADSPGWPDLVLADFVECFDERALETYRRAVAALDSRLEGADQFKRFEVERMLLELADHDGDVDRAVELLSDRERPQYGAIVDRLRAAGRGEDAVRWIDQAVAEGRISSQGSGNDYWLSPDDVAATYRKLGRIDDAVGVLRADFVRQPSVGAFSVLLDFAASVNCVERERTWAFGYAHQLAASDRFAFGAVLVQLHLSEGDIDAAWEAADRYGPGWAWRELAERGAAARPVAAADLYRPQLESDLRYPDTKLYPGIAASLKTMAKLYERGGRSAEFASFLAQIRRDYGRRPSLMKALDAKGL